MFPNVNRNRANFQEDGGERVLEKVAMQTPQNKRKQNDTDLYDNEHTKKHRESKACESAHRAIESLNEQEMSLKQVKQRKYASEWRYLAGEVYRQEKNDRQAAKWYRLAADLDHPGAMCALAYMHHKGEGVEQDYQEAITLYRSAVHLGHEGARCNLGVMYERGEGVTKDVKQAFRLYHMAANRGVASAQVNVGYLHAFGSGVERNHRRAVRWYKLAAAQGFSRGLCLLGGAYEKGLGIEINLQKAMQCYQVALNEGHICAHPSLERVQARLS